MALTKDQKTAQVKDLKNKLEKAKSVTFVHYRGLSVADIDDLRGALLEKNAEMKVAKKTLFRIASKDAGYPEVEDSVLDGPIGFVFSYEDEVSGPKAAHDFRKKSDLVELIGGIVDGKVLSKEQAVELAKTMSKEELLGTFAVMIRSPLSNFASICSSPLRGFAIGLKELAEKGGVSGESAEQPVAEEAPAEPEATAEEPKAEETTDASSEETPPAEEAPEDKPES